MRLKILFLLAFILLFIPTSVLADGDVAILTPTSGQSVKGRVEITGYIKVSSYAGYEVEFADDGSESPGWYPIQTGEKLSTDGLLGIWDTTTITDGNYQLRLTVRLNDGSSSTAIVRGIRVRNYSPVEQVTVSSGQDEVPIQATPTLALLIPADGQYDETLQNPVEISTGRYQFHTVVSILIGLMAGLALAIIFRKQKPRL